MALALVERPAAGAAERALLLLPGYADEPTVWTDRLDLVDPDRRWHVTVARPPDDTPEGPAWYQVHDDGPDAGQLAASVAAVGQAAAALVAGLALPPDRLVVAGYSQGGAVALATLVDPTVAERPHAVAAIAAHLPHRDDHLEPALAARHQVLFVHGSDDDVVDPLLGRSAAKVLGRAGATVDWVEVEAGHALGPALLAPLASWLTGLTEAAEAHEPPEAGGPATPPA